MVVLNVAGVRAAFPDWESQLEWGGRLEGSPATQGEKLEGAPWNQGFGGSQPPKAARQTGARHKTGLYKDDNLQLTDTAFTLQSDKPSKNLPKVSSSLWSKSTAKPGPNKPPHALSNAPSKQWSGNSFNPPPDIQSNHWSKKPFNPEPKTAPQHWSTNLPVIQQAGHSMFPYDPRPEKTGPESRTFGEDEVSYATVTLTSQ